MTAVVKGRMASSQEECAMSSSEKKLQGMLDEVQAEFAAFRESSAELEDELEKELGIVEARARKSEEELRQAKAANKDATGQLVREVRVWSSWRRDNGRATRNGSRTC